MESDIKQKPSYSSFREVIEAWPRAGLAADIGLEPHVVRNWKGLPSGRRQNIPAAYWNAVVAAAKERGIQGVTLKLLSDLAEAGGHF